MKVFLLHKWCPGPIPPRLIHCSLDTMRGRFVMMMEMSNATIFTLSCFNIINSIDLTNNTKVIKSGFLVSPSWQRSSYVEEETGRSQRQGGFEVFCLMLITTPEVFVICWKFWLKVDKPARLSFSVSVFVKLNKKENKYWDGNAV